MQVQQDATPAPATAVAVAEEAAITVDDEELLLSPHPLGAPSAVGGFRSAAIDPAVHRFPFCLVWSPIPILTWFLPFIGHLGIADSKGIIFDFAGPYTIGRDDFAFGIPTRYVQCAVASEDVAKWDEAVAAGCAIYETRMHNLWYD
ncbi:hypothetical protein BBJ28_00009808 [Nothophytophthora sp. Chile5]|nr:hypothetical protein BBJ28_00009808 [Nothophytophthora sp. Chile5]